MISYRKLAMRVLGHSPVSAAKTARRRSTAKRAAALALTAALVVGMTLPAFAQDWYIDKGDITISAGANGNDVTQNGTTTKDDTDTVIKGNGSSSHTVTIDAAEGKTVDVTLDNVNIDASSGAAVSVTGKGDTNIELNGNNTLTSGDGHAGLEHNKTDDSGTLTITDDKGAAGSLTANGGFGGAGIGGSNEKDGQVTITGGEITANGGKYGAGIGGGDSGNGTVTITDGDITANGGSQGAGIGGGSGNIQAVGGDGDVTISGGTITATGGSEDAHHSGGAGIGGGVFGNGTVIITDGDITAKSTGMYGAGIGGGSGAKPSGTLIGGNGTVTISGGTITEASGARMAAGIGSGYQGLGTVTIEGDAVIKNAQGGDSGAAGIGGGTLGIGDVTIKDSAQIGNAIGGEEGAGIGGGRRGLGNVSIEGNVTIKNAQGGAGAAGIGGGAESEPDAAGNGNKISIKSTAAGSPNITAKGGEGKDDEKRPIGGGAAIGSGSVYETIGQVNAKSDITIEGKVTIDATGGGDVAIGDSTGETRFSGLQVGTTIKRTDSNGKDVTQDGDVVAEPEPEPKPEPEEPEKPAQPTVTPTEGAEAPSTGSVEVERPVTVEGLYVTNVLGKQITHTCTQNGTTLTIRANGIVTSAHLTLGMVRTLKAQGVKTLVLTTLLSRSTTVSVDALLAADPDAPDETPVVWTHTGPRTALTIGGADHSALLK